jgi:hypothetical protein
MRHLEMFSLSLVCSRYAKHLQYFRSAQVSPASNLLDT